MRPKDEHQLRKRIGAFYVLAKPFGAGLRSGFLLAFTGFAPVPPTTSIPAIWRGETNPRNGFFVIRDDFGRISADFERGAGWVKHVNPEIEFDFPRQRS